MFIGLNPSTADESINDPTIRRCINYAKDWGYGAMIMANIFAYRSTDPKGLKEVSDPIGPENDASIIKIAWEAAVVVLCWGGHGKYLNRGNTIVQLLKDKVPLKCIEVGNGFPKHPLYLKKDLAPIPFPHHLTTGTI